MSQYSHLKADLDNENSPVTKLTNLIGRDRRVLDIGCAHGYLAEALSSRGCRVVGVERNADDASRARTHCEQVIVADVEEPGWLDALTSERFDVVVFSDILEHLRDPAAVLRRAPELLADDGRVVASIPNVAHVSIRLELLLGSFERETLGILDRTHLHFFTHDAVQQLFASCGLAIESWDCTTNEISDDLIARHLDRFKLAYTRELREELSSFEAMAYQFIVEARPARAPVELVATSVEKPLQTMQRTLEEFQSAVAETRRERDEVVGLLRQTEQSLADTHRGLAETHRELAETRRERDESRRERDEFREALRQTEQSLADTHRELDRSRVLLRETEQSLADTHARLSQREAARRRLWRRLGVLVALASIALFAGLRLAGR